jgi:hypothetical protein
MEYLVPSQRRKEEHEVVTMEYEPGSCRFVVVVVRFGKESRM